MSSISTFGTFTMARLGLYASQKGIMVTGNNISNINTEGYTRQVVDQTSWHTGASDRYKSKMDFKIGNGALVTGVNQIRDQYLDIRYRNEQASVGALQTKSEGLTDLARLLDEVGKGDDEGGIMEEMFNQMVTQMEQLVSEGAGRDNYDTLFRDATESLLHQLNKTAGDLEALREDHVDKLHQQVDDVNSLLERIRDMNMSIRKNQVYGGNNLEQLDARNNLIDELSQYVRIDVTYEQEELGEGLTVEKLKITTQDKPERTLVDGVYATQFSIRQEGGQDSGNFDLDLGKLTDQFGHTLTTRTTANVDLAATTAEDAEAELAAYPARTVDADGNVYDNEYELIDNGDGTFSMKHTRSYSGEAQLTDTELYGSLQSEREFLTEKGVFATAADKAHDTDASIKRGIQFYQKALDVFANKLAQTLNDANTNAGGGILISNSGITDDTADITAMNITISRNWANGSRRIIPDENYQTLSTASGNLQYILNQLTGEHKFSVNMSKDADALADDTFFTGSFQEMFTTHITGTLASDQRTTDTMLSNHSTNADALYVDRDAVSGVDLNDETMNMMRYQRSYQAAARLMTTYDSMLDKLINGTAV